jgi:hypothetical protein
MRTSQIRINAVGENAKCLIARVKAEVRVEIAKFHKCASRALLPMTERFFLHLDRISHFSLFLEEVRKEGRRG